METQALPSQIDMPRLTVDRTGWVTVKASPQWWRSTAHAEDWADIVEQLASAGEDSVSPGLCRVIGTTTKTPCKIDTSREPCPHHGPGNEKNRCGAPKARGGGSCRWNLVMNGECPNHPETWQQLLETRRAEEEREQQRREAEMQRRAAERAQRTRDALTVPCPYCAAEPDGECVKLGTNVPAPLLHAPRYKLLDHRRVAARAGCASCGSELDALCRTSSGKDASDAHAERVRAAVE